MTDGRARLVTILGACVQGVVLGALLFFAVLELIEASSADRVFRYQGF